MLGDDIVRSKTPCLKQLLQVYNRYRTSVLGVQKVELHEVSKYGIIACREIDPHVYKVEDLIEKPKVEESPSNIAIMGRYIITPEIFNILQGIKPGKGGEIQLTDALKELNDREVIYAYTFQGKRYDVGDKLGYLQATIEFARERMELREPLMSYLESMVDQYRSDKKRCMGLSEQYQEERL